MKLADNIFDGNPFLQRLKKNSMQKLDGGEKILVPLEYAQATASGWYQGAETLDTQDSEVLSAASFDWKQLYANITISRRDELKNSGDAGVIRFVKAKVRNAEKTLLDNLASAVYNDGSDAKAIIGARKFVSTTQTYGGIDQSANSWWQAQVDSSTTTLTLAAVQSLYNSASLNNEQPTVILSTRANYDRYYALLQPVQRFVDSETAKGGFTSLMFNGKPWIPDSHCPANYVFGFNENMLHLFVHKDEDMRFEEFAKPVNQNIKLAKIYSMMALASSNNRMHFVLSAITA